MSIKPILKIILQGLGAMLAFVFSLVIANMLSPLSPEIMAASTTASGFLSTPMAFLFNAVINAVILVWAARRSSFRGLIMVGQLFVLSFGAQVFMTQIETGYFMSAFPLLHNNFQIYNLVFRGLITSVLLSVLVTWIVGGFSKKTRPESNFTVTTDNAVKQGAWLSVVYIILYMLAGYFIAWQVKELRLFYGGPAELNGFFEQWGLTAMAKPEFPAFQYFRGTLWMLCLVPLFMGFSGKRVELIVLSALALALLPTAQLAFANPLMPAAVSLGHFWEVSISTGIFGALCAWFVPAKTNLT
ncbi:MAG: hypothetical protein IPO36_06645 [Anaerolineales bacterium]|nr:hypothetical protein [Anaerolineales bacterium]